MYTGMVSRIQSILKIVHHIKTNKKETIYLRSLLSYGRGKKTRTSQPNWAGIWRRSQNTKQNYLL